MGKSLPEAGRRGRTQQTTEGEWCRIATPLHLQALDVPGRADHKVVHGADVGVGDSDPVQAVFSERTQHQRGANPVLVDESAGGAAFAVGGSVRPGHQVGSLSRNSCHRGGRARWT